MAYLETRGLEVNFDGFKAVDGLDFSVVTVENNLVGDNELCRWLEKPGEDFHLYKKGDNYLHRTVP